MRILIYELITAGGLGDDVAASLRQEGAAMLTAVVEDFERVRGVEILTLVDRRLPPIGRCCRSVDTSEEAFAFREVSSAADAALVIAPEFNGLLAARSQAALDAGCRLLGSHPDAIRITGDKLRLAQMFEERGIPTPTTQLAGGGFPRDIRMPCVLKPRHGAGSQATFLIRRPCDWTASLRQAQAECPDADLIVQPFCSGLAVSVAFLVGSAQTLATPGATQRFSDDGRFHYCGGRTPLPLRLRERAVALAARAIGCVNSLAGYVGVDLVMGAAPDSSEDAVIEINPRLTTSYLGLRRVTKENLAGLWLKVWRGETAAPPTWDEKGVNFFADGRTRQA